MISGQLPCLHSPHVLQDQFHTTVEHLDRRMLRRQMLCHWGTTVNISREESTLGCNRMGCSSIRFGEKDMSV